MKKTLLGSLIGVGVAMLALLIFGILSYPSNPTFEGNGGYHAIMMVTVSIIALPVGAILGAVIQIIHRRKRLQTIEDT
jgi:hypothetical protein